MSRHARIPWWWRRLITVHVLMWPPNAKLPRSAPTVLNGRCRAHLDMSRSSLGVVLRGLLARGRSVAFPVWWKHCISRTMMEWLTLKWSSTLLWLKPPLCMLLVLMWPPNAILPRSAPAVLNDRCRTRLDMSRSSLGIVLRGLLARGRSVTFPVWWKHGISRTMMEWLTQKWSVTFLWLISPLCMPCVLMWPPNAKLPWSAPAVLNSRCRARLDMSRSFCEVYLHVDGQ